jgi:hypothetical protein
MTLRITILYIECHYAEGRDLNIFMLSVIMLKVIMLNVVMLNIVMLNVIMLRVIMLSVIMLSVIMLNVIMLNVVAPRSFNILIIKQINLDYYKFNFTGLNSS